MSYQSVIRDASNNLLTSQNVGMQISILQGSTSGTAVYVETQTPTSNANGLVSIEIGTGTIVSGNFNTIIWANGPYFIKTETDPTGGINYTITGTSQLLSVPYALHAKSAESVTGVITETDPLFIASPAKGITSGDITNWNNKLDIEQDSSLTNEIQALSINNDTVYLSNGGFVKLPAGFDGQYSSLTGKPTNVSSFANDAGYLNSDTTIWKRDSDNIYYNSGNVGIGTTNPANQLHISGAAEKVYTMTENTQTTGQSHAGVWTKNNIGSLMGIQQYGTSYVTNNSHFTDGSHLFSSGAGGMSIESRNSNANANLRFYTNNMFERMRITVAGNVGIGTTNPTSKLDVNGVITATGGNSANWNTAYSWGNHAAAGYLKSEKDSSLTNEIQALSISNDTVFLSNGGFVKLPIVDGSETKIVGGNNINLNGTGTAINPYVVAVSPEKFYLGQDTLGGIVFYIYIGSDGQQHGLIVSKTESTGTWSGSTIVGANKTSDGAFNTNLMPAGSTAKTWVTALGAGWYLPSFDELSILWHNRFHVNNSTAGGVTLLSNAIYWSSTEYNANYAFVFYFNIGNANNSSGDKPFTYSVRAVRAF